MGDVLIMVKKRDIKLIFKWMLSYLMVFVIPMVACILVYLSAAGVIKGDINVVSEYVMTQLQLSFDNVTNQVYAFSHQIALDNEMNELIYKDNFDLKDRLKIKNIVSRFAYYKTTATMVDDCYVYSKKTNTVIKHSGFYDSKTISAAIPIAYENNEEKWEEIKQGKYNNKAFRYSYINGAGGINECVSYCIPFPLHSNKADGIIIVCVDTKRYKDIVTKIYDNNDFVVLDSEYGILFSTMNEEKEDVFLESYSDSCTEIEILGTKYRINEKKSVTNASKYLSLQDEHIAFNKLSYVSNIMLFVLLLSIIAGIVCALHFSKKHYSPIKGILSLLTQHKLLKNSMDYSEDKLIFDSILTLINENNQNELKLYRQQDYVRASVFSKIINKAIDTDTSCKKLFEICDVNFEYENFFVICFHIYENDEDISDKYELRYIVIKSIFEELLNNHYKTYICNINGYVCAVCNVSNENKTNSKTNVKEILQLGQRTIADSFNMEFAVAVSETVEGVLSIRESFHEAKDCIDDLVFKQSKNIVFCEELARTKQKKEEYYFTFAREQRFADYIKEGKKDDAKAFVENFFSLFDSDVHMNVIRILIFDIVATLYKSTSKADSIDFSRVYSMLSDGESISIKDLENEIFTLIDEIIESEQIVKQENESEVIQKIKNLIAMQYNNVNLNVAYIGNELDLNSNYCSYVFSKRTGEGLLNYINNYRISISKDLLVNGDLSVDVISRMVGFANSNTFIRVFKKYEGITPGKYRENKK